LRLRLSHQFWQGPSVFVKPNTEQTLLGKRGNDGVLTGLSTIDGDFIWRTLDRAPLAQPLLPMPLALSP
jgi:hypothetical protein